MEVVTNYLDSDFQKAFDKVPHQRLIMKLAAHGLGRDILQWIGNWLSNRKQRVVLNGLYSGWRDVLNRILGMVKRNFTDRSKEVIITLYKSLVRPHYSIVAKHGIPITVRILI